MWQKCWKKKQEGDPDWLAPQIREARARAEKADKDPQGYKEWMKKRKQELLKQAEEAKKKAILNAYKEGQASRAVVAAEAAPIESENE